MAETGFSQNTTIYISSKSHLNITFNLLQCGVQAIPAQGVLSVNSTGSFTLLYINEGAGLLDANTLAYKITHQQGFFAFPDTHYDLKNIGDEPLGVTWLSFTGYQVENYLNRANVYRTRPIFSDSGDQLGRKINSLYDASKKMPNRYCRMMSILYAFFSTLLDLNPTQNRDGYVDNSEFYAAKAVDYIELNYARNLNVSDIATALGISRKHLYAIFNDVLKIAPKQYLIYYRIERACVRLKSTTQPVQDIAESVGYANQFYFAKEFKRLTGMTPSEYRKDPEHTEIFSYRSFVPTLKERPEDHSIDLPLDEAIISIYSPPTPRARRSTP